MKYYRVNHRKMVELYLTEGYLEMMKGFSVDDMTDEMCVEACEGVWEETKRQEEEALNG